MVFVDSALGTNGTTCGTALGAGCELGTRIDSRSLKTTLLIKLRRACNTFALGLANANALNATLLTGCANVTINVAPGNYTGAGNIGIDVTPALAAAVPLQIGL